jgi:phage shock protein PspC (stress-responsive transcriptional regulator)
MNNDTTPPDEVATGTSTTIDDRAGSDHAGSDHAGSDHATSDHATSDHASSDHAGGAGPKRLVRDTRSAVLGGVAAGLGRYLGLDPVVVRLGFIVLALAGGVGVVAYVIAWVVIPADDGSAQPAEEMRRAAESVPVWVQVMAVLLVALFLTGQLGGFPGSVAWAAVLIGAGILLFRDSDGSPAQTPPAHTAPAGTAAPLPPAPPRAPSILGRLTVAALLIWTGVAALLDNVGAIDLAPRQYVAAALVIVGGALVIGTWWGRGRALILLGLALLPVLLFAGFPTDAIRGGMGDRVYTPQTISDVASGYELFAGTMTIDLSDLRPTGDALRVSARHGLGELVIIVPEDVDVIAEGWLLAGEARIIDRLDEGVGVSYAHRITAPDARGTVVLDVQQGLGTLVVRHAR